MEWCDKVLQTRFGIITNPSRQWDQKAIIDIMMACVMLHNMIIEDEHIQNLESTFDVNENIQFKWGLSFEE